MSPSKDQRARKGLTGKKVKVRTLISKQSVVACKVLGRARVTSTMGPIPIIFACLAEKKKKIRLYYRRCKDVPLPYQKITGSRDDDNKDLAMQGSYST